MTGSTTLAQRLRGVTAEVVFTGRSLRHSLRDGESLLMAILLPVLLMMMFTWIFGGAIDPTGQYVDYVVPGIILTCAGFGASGTAIQVAADMQSGIIDRFRTMPLRSNAVLTGHVIASLARNLAATAIVFGVALAMGFRPDASWADWLGVVGLIALYILALTYLFAGIGLAASSPEGANGYGFILLFLPYLSSGFVPVESLPSWLQGIAAYQPLTPIIDTLRGLLLGGELEAEPWWALFWCAAVLSFAVLWGAWLFRRKAGRR